MEKVIALKAGVLKKVEGAREKSEKTKLVIDSLELALDMEAESLRQDFRKSQLGGHRGGKSPRMCIGFS